MSRYDRSDLDDSPPPIRVRGLTNTEGVTKHLIPKKPPQRKSYCVVCSAHILVRYDTCMMYSL